MTCPTCGAKVLSPFVRVGAVARCRSCGHQFKVDREHVARLPGKPAPDDDPLLPATQPAAAAPEPSASSSAAARTSIDRPTAPPRTDQPEPSNVSDLASAAKARTPTPGHAPPAPALPRSDATAPLDPHRLAQRVRQRRTRTTIFTMASFALVLAGLLAAVGYLAYSNNPATPPAPAGAGTGTQGFGGGTSGNGSSVDDGGTVEAAGTGPLDAADTDAREVRELIRAAGPQLPMLPALKLTPWSWESVQSRSMVTHGLTPIDVRDAQVRVQPRGGLYEAKVGTASEHGFVGATLTLWLRDVREQVYARCRVPLGVISVEHPQPLRVSIPSDLFARSEEVDWTVEGGDRLEGGMSLRIVRYAMHSTEHHTAVHIVAVPSKPIRRAAFGLRSFDRFDTLVEQWLVRRDRSADAEEVIEFLTVVEHDAAAVQRWAVVGVGEPAAAAEHAHSMERDR